MSSPTVAAFIERVEADPETYFGPVTTVVNQAGDALFVRVALSGETAEAEVALRELRDDIIPSTFGAAGVEALVGFMAEFKAERG